MYVHICIYIYEYIYNFIDFSYLKYFTSLRKIEKLKKANLNINIVNWFQINIKRLLR